MDEKHSTCVPLIQVLNVYHIVTASNTAQLVQGQYSKNQHAPADKACGLQAAVLVVPFVDVVSTMSDPRLPATVVEYEVNLFSATSSLYVCPPAGLSLLLVDNAL